VARRDANGHNPRRKDAPRAIANGHTPIGGAEGREAAAPRGPMGSEPRTYTVVYADGRIERIEEQHPLASPMRFADPATRAGGPSDSGTVATQRQINKSDAWGTGQVPDDLPTVDGNKPPTQVYGASGTAFFGGIISQAEEYNPDFYWKQGIELFERMRRSDGTVAALEQMLILPLLAAKWTIEPASEDPQDQELASFAETCLFHEIRHQTSRGGWLAQTWPEILRHILLMLPFGFSVFELCYRVEPDTGWAKWGEWRPLLPRTIWRWYVDADNDLVGIQQRTWKNYHWDYPKIPAEKLVHFAHQQEGQNFEGRSVFRAAYQHWYYKQQFYRVEAIGIERMAVAMPFIILGPAPSADDIKNAQAIVKNMRVSEDMGGTLPQGSDVKFPNNHRGHPDIQKPIEHHDALILRSALAQFLMNGALQNGSRAMDQGQGERFLAALQAVAYSIECVVSDGPIKQLVDYNFDNVALYPRLKCSKLVAQDLTMLGQALGVLSPYLNPSDPVIRDFVTETYGIPKPSMSPVVATNITGPGGLPGMGQGGGGGGGVGDQGPQQPMDVGGADYASSGGGGAGQYGDWDEDERLALAEYAGELSERVAAEDAIERALAHYEALALADDLRGAVELGELDERDVLDSLAVLALAEPDEDEDEDSDDGEEVRP